MSKNVILFRPRRFVSESPAISAALYAVEHGKMPQVLRATAQVAARVFFPTHLHPIDREVFFSLEEKRSAKEEGYRSLMRFLENLQKELVL